MAHRHDATQASSAVRGDARQDTSANSSRANTNNSSNRNERRDRRDQGDSRGTRPQGNNRDRPADRLTPAGHLTDAERERRTCLNLFSSVASQDTPTRTVPATATTTATLSPTRRGLVRPRGTLPRPRLHQPTIAIRTVPRAKATARTRQVVISATPSVGRRSLSTVRRRKSQAPLLRPTRETRLRPSNDAGPGSRTTPR